MIIELQNAFETARCPDIAKQQEAYMKNRFPFLGLKAPLRRKLQKEHLSRTKNLEETALALWNLPEREYAYAALDLMQKHRQELTLPFLRTLIEARSWWDTVDLLAGNLLGHTIAQNPHHIGEMDKWIEDPNFWVRRSALIFQLKWKQNTDEERLFAYCKKRAHEPEFFIRKAIGWALREYSKTTPEAVAHFLRENRPLLSSLSYREAAKKLSQ